MMVNAAERVFRGGFARPVSHYPPTLAGRDKMSDVLVARAADALIVVAIFAAKAWVALGGLGALLPL